MSSDVEFEEPLESISRPRTYQFSQRMPGRSYISSWMIRNRFAKDEKQANSYMIAISVVCIILAIIIPVFFL